ncbi:MAG: hypothetical protein CMN05_14785 [Roseibacillus sp.]|jgi:hypothetical protein|nr:hypothetical protein [Roseibacillus sp.]MBP35884.1 hypothetical protein [Roseibacillus sp.]MCP4729397.1 hypothetical protein [Roseibacillus sp.]MDP6208842.1 hypothetical protein [Roseibacillus sp.]MDP7107657.1 hypothetical protein [Roseibacillus sp.]|tara:strand:- start:6399 stop:6593 length:195 start_codon:yes stop_codon:yes gene_type:complete
MFPDSLHLACSTCVKSFQEGGGDAAGWSIIFLLATIVPVLGATGICMARIVRRERENFDPKYAE